MYCFFWRKRDFDIIVDIRGFKPTNLKVLNKIRVGTSIFEEFGIRNTIFVVGGSNYALKMFAKFVGYSADELIYFVPTKEEAEHKMMELTGV